MEARQLLQPLRPLILGGQQTISHVAKKLDLHYVDLLNSYTRHLSPGLVRVGVIVQELVSQHKRHGEKPVFAARATIDFGVRALQPVHEEQCQEDHVLGDLGGRQNGVDPFLVSSIRPRVRRQRGYRCVRVLLFHALGRLDGLHVLEPEEACHLQKR